MTDTADLNPEQARAVRTTEGPVLILAGAGSGKTRVLTRRIAHLLSLGVAPDTIVGVTFTNKAAEEMRERVAAMVDPQLAGKLVLSTFHSLGARILREDPEGFGLPSSRFSILDQGDALGIVRSLLAELRIHVPGGERRFDVAAVLTRIGLWKNAFETPEAVAGRRHDDPYDAVAAEVYGPYQERLEALGAVDFDDLVCRVAQVLATDGEVARRWQARFQYLMVDEYQDTNAAQLEMVRHLAGPARNLCVVGDDDQAIYGFRGATVANILSFEDHFPGAAVIKLERNYRSRPAILRAANAVIAHNRYRHAKTLRPTRAEGPPVTCVVTPDGEAEAAWVVRKIRALLAEPGVRPSDVAVLYRSAAQARPLETHLQLERIAYRVLGGQAVYDRKEVKDALAYFQLLVAPGNDLAVRRALETPPRGLGPAALRRLADHARTRNRRLWSAVLDGDAVDGLAPAARRALASVRELVARGREDARRFGHAAALEGMLDAVDLRGLVERSTGSEAAAAARWDGVRWLLSAIDRFEKQAAGERPAWHEFLATLTLAGRNDGTDETDRACVTLATLHSAKGLEWDHVFLVGCEEGRLPHSRALSPRANDPVPGDVEEERRLFYVGVTRAREQLFLVRAARRVERGRIAERTPSRFLAELPDDVAQHDAVHDEVADAADVASAIDAFLAGFGADAPPS